MHSRRQLAMDAQMLQDHGLQHLSPTDLSMLYVHKFAILGDLDDSQGAFQSHIEY